MHKKVIFVVASVMACAASAEESVARDNAFNPGIALILAGRYSYSSLDPSQSHVAGFVAARTPEPYARGLSLSETELDFSANIDPLFHGALNLAVGSDNTIAAEEAYFQTLALAPGWTLKAGRFLSGIGYLNARHAHTWDFADHPLAYRAIVNSRLAQEGVQLKWLAPWTWYWEFGAEIGRGAEFPAGGDAGNGAGAGAAFAHTGGDIGDSQSWRAGLSWLRTQPRARDSVAFDSAGVPETRTFTGFNDTLIADGVWKWAPRGNAVNQYIILQGEWLWRRERGDVTDGARSGAYNAAQSGAYGQLVWQFRRNWRIGLRGDLLDSGQVEDMLSVPVRYHPRAVSAMFDWSPSEYSRLRLQVTRDQSRAGKADTRVIMQYQMSLGAHGAHQF